MQKNKYCLLLPALASRTPAVSGWRSLSCRPQALVIVAPHSAAAPSNATGAFRCTRLRTHQELACYLLLLPLTTRNCAILRITCSGLYFCTYKQLSPAAASRQILDRHQPRPPLRIPPLTGALLLSAFKLLIASRVPQQVPQKDGGSSQAQQQRQAGAPR